MKNLLLLFLLSATLGFIGCEAAGEHEHMEEAVDLDALRAELQAMEDAYAKGSNAKDAQAVVAYYSDDAHSLAPDKPTLIGKAAILADIQAEMASDTSGSTIAFQVVDVFADGDLAVEVGKSVTTMPDGSKSTGKYISVFEKRDGKWICVRDMYNRDAPEKAAE